MRLPADEAHRGHQRECPQQPFAVAVDSLALQGGQSAPTEHHSENPEWHREAEPSPADADPTHALTSLHGHGACILPCPMPHATGSGHFSFVSQQPTSGGVADTDARRIDRPDRGRSAEDRPRRPARTPSLRPRELNGSDGGQRRPTHTPATLERGRPPERARGRMSRRRLTDQRWQRPATPAATTPAPSPNTTGAHPCTSGRFRQGRASAPTPAGKRSVKRVRGRTWCRPASAGTRSARAPKRQAPSATPNRDSSERQFGAAVMIRER